jgi:transposase
MGRSHAWLPRGEILIETRPMTWGDNLALVGTIRVDKWLTLATSWGAMNRARFIQWVRRHLVRHLRPGDIVVLDNLAAHQARQVQELVEAVGAQLRFLPPYSHDFNPLESAWALIKKRIRSAAPRTGRALRQAAQRARSIGRPSTTLSELVRPCRLRTQVIDGSGSYTSRSPRAVSCDLIGGHDEAERAGRPGGVRGRVDGRLDERLRRIVALASADPAQSFPEQMESVADREALDRFLSNPKVTLAGVLSGHVRQTHERMRDRELV